MIYLVEAYGTDVAVGQDEVAKAVEARNPGSIRHLATIPVPTDEVVFRLFSSTSRDVLVDTLEAAAVPYARISEVDGGAFDERWAQAIRKNDDEVSQARSGTT